MKIIKIHPVLNREHMCRHHSEPELTSLGDKYGTDFVVVGFDINNISWAAPHKGDGTNNEDWFGWHSDILAPVDGVIKEVYVNPIINEPGKMIPGRATSIVIETAEEVYITLAHLQDPMVRKGDKVVQGQSIAKMGNNGYSRNPHVHIGAWKDDEPLAIEVDRDLLISLQSKMGEVYWMFGITDDEYMKRKMQ